MNCHNSYAPRQITLQQNLKLDSFSLVSKLTIYIQGRTDGRVACGTCHILKLYISYAHMYQLDVIGSFGYKTHSCAPRSTLHEFKSLLSYSVFLFGN